MTVAWSKVRGQGLDFPCLVEGRQHQGNYTKHAHLLFSIPREEETNRSGHRGISKTPASRCTRIKKVCSQPEAFLRKLWGTGKEHFDGGRSIEDNENPGTVAQSIAGTSSPSSVTES